MLGLGEVERIEPWCRRHEENMGEIRQVWKRNTRKRDNRELVGKVDSFALVKGYEGGVF